MTFLYGLLAGILISAPVGPTGALAIHLVVQRHRHAAWMLATGACLGDALLAITATWSTRLPIPDWILALGAASLMSVMAGYFWWTAERPAEVPNKAASLGVGFFSTVLHPGNIVSFAAVFAWLNSQNPIAFDSMPERALVGIAVFCGGFGMWTLLIRVTQHYGYRLKLGQEAMFKRGLAILCALTAVMALLSLKP